MFNLLVRTIPFVISNIPHVSVVIISFKFMYFKNRFVIIVNIIKLPNIIIDVFVAFRIDFFNKINILFSFMFFSLLGLYE